MMSMVAMLISDLMTLITIKIDSAKIMLAVTMTVVVTTMLMRMTIMLTTSTTKTTMMRMGVMECFLDLQWSFSSLCKILAGNLPFS